MSKSELHTIAKAIKTTLKGILAILFIIVYLSSNQFQAQMLIVWGIKNWTFFVQQRLT